MTEFLSEMFCYPKETGISLPKRTAKYKSLVRICHHWIKWHILLVNLVFQELLHAAEIVIFTRKLQIKSLHSLYTMTTIQYTSPELKRLFIQAGFLQKFCHFEVSCTVKNTEKNLLYGYKRSKPQKGDFELHHDRQFAISCNGYG